MRLRWGLVAVGLLSACSDDAESSRAVCDLLESPLDEVDYPVDSNEHSVADVLARMRTELAGDSYTAAIYLVPAASSDPTEFFEVVTEVAGSDAVALFTQEDSLAEFSAELGESSPELVETLDASSLPAWALIRTNDADLIDEVASAVEEAGLPIYRVVTPRGPELGRALVRGEQPLRQLAEQDDDADVAEAASAVLAALPDGELLDESAFTIEDDYRALIAAAESCGLVDE
jgi:hypothetical protein